MKFFGDIYIIKNYIYFGGKIWLWEGCSWLINILFLQTQKCIKDFFYFLTIKNILKTFRFIMIFRIKNFKDFLTETLPKNVNCIADFIPKNIYCFGPIPRRKRFETNVIYPWPKLIGKTINIPIHLPYIFGPKKHKHILNHFRNIFLGETKALPAVRGRIVYELIISQMGILLQYAKQISNFVNCKSYCFPFIYWIEKEKKNT